MHGASGNLGDQLIYRQRGGKTVAYVPPCEYPPSTPAQVANQERYYRANDFANAIIKDPEKKAYYKSIAKPGQTAFNAAFSDAYHKPEVEEVVVEEKIIIKVKAKHPIVKVIVGTGRAILHNGYWEHKLVETPFTVIIHDIAGNICTQEIKI